MTTRLTASSLANPIIKTVNTTFSAPNPKVMSDVEGPFYIALGKTSKGTVATVNLKSIGDAAAAKTTLILDGASSDYTFKTKSGAVTVSTIANGSQKAIVIATLDLTNALDTPFIKFNDLTAKLHADTAKSQAELVVIPSPTFSLANDTGISETDGITSDGTLTVSTHSGATLSYCLNGGMTYTKADGNSIELPVGKYPAGTIKMIESDQGAVSAVTTNTKDIVVKQTIAVPSIKLANDTGSSNTDDITKTVTVNVSGVEVGATWQYAFNAAEFFDGSGSSFSLPEDATYNKGDIQVRQIDKAGNESDANGIYGSNDTTWILDTTAEKLADFTIVDTGTNGDFVTDSAKFTVNDLENGAKLWYNFDGSNNFLSTSDNTFTFNVPSGEYANGKIQLKQSDKAGNESVVTPFNFKLLVNDNLPTFDSIADDGVINAEEKTGGVVITGDAKSGSKAVSIQIENGTAKPAIVNADGTWSYDLLSSEIVGTNLTIKATATDVNGVVNPQSKTIDVIIDTEASAPTFDIIAENDTISPTEKSEGVTMTGTTETGSTVAISINGGIEALATVLDGVWNYKIPTAQIKEGTLKITATATDKAGNDSVAVVKNVDVLASFGAIAEDGVINAEEKASGVVIIGDIKAGSKSVSIQIDNGTPKPAILKSDGSWSYDLLPSDIVGDNLSITAAFTDKYGIVSKETRDIIIDAQASAPTFDIVAEDGIISPSEKIAGVTITGTTEVGATVAISVDGGKEALATVIDGVWNYKLPAVQMKEGTIKITATATDKAGNESIAADKTVTIEKTNVVSVDVSATNTTTYDAGTAKLNFFVSGDNYIYNIVNFAAGDQVNFPIGNMTVKNDSATDRTVDLQYANTVLHLTGLLLTDAQESAIVDVNSFNSAFGAGSILQ